MVCILFVDDFKALADWHIRDLVGLYIWDVGLLCQIVSDVALELDDYIDELRVACDDPCSAISQGLEDVLAGIDDLTCSNQLARFQQSTNGISELVPALLIQCVLDVSHLWAYLQNFESRDHVDVEIGTALVREDAIL